MATNFQKISGKYYINGASPNYVEEAYGDESDAPCYCERIEMPGEMTQEDIGKYLRSAQRQTIGVILTSVTEKDDNRDVVIAEAKKIKGATVTRGRSTNHGGYPCWLIALPGTAKA